MNHYYISDFAHPTDGHTVHSDKCEFLPLPGDRTYLGYYGSCQDAILIAKAIRSTVGSCAHCCPDCQDKQSGSAAPTEATKKSSG